MISIEERDTNKLPGTSSLHIKFDYNPDIVNAIKSCNSAIWDAKNKEWECPVTTLSRLLDSLCEYDDIGLKLLKDKKKKDDRVYELVQHKTKPYPYQYDGVQYGLNHPNFLLLDAPGLGKTLQAIQLAEERKEKEGIQHCLIICGINTLKANWKKEINIHSKYDCMILGERIQKTGKIRSGSVAERLEDLKKPIKEFFVILNIETLRSDDVVKELNSTKNNKFDMIVVDETHRFKSPTSQQSKGFLKLKCGKYRVCMTGTLLLNSPLDAYVPLKFIGKEKCCYTNFKYHYCTYTGPFNNIFLGYKNIPILKQQLDECSIRRTKDILDLPPKNIINEFLEMDDNQKLFYDNIKKGVVEQADKVELNTANLLALTSRLRQATECPSILTSENIESAKINRAADLIEELISNNEKVVVFSVFKEPLNVLAEKIKEYDPRICTGDVKESEIEKNIDDFKNDPNCKVLLCTTAKMGTGLTLTAASYAIFLSTPWTESDFLQCCDRVHRIGASKSVFIYCLWCADTIDVHVKDIIDSKGAISDYVIDNKVNANFATKLREIILDLQQEEK